MTSRTATILKCDELSDLFYYEIVDEKNQRHIVQVPRNLLEVAPSGYERRSDQDHLDTIARGIVMNELNCDVCFHNAASSQVERAYAAVYGRR